MVTIKRLRYQEQTVGKDLFPFHTGVHWSPSLGAPNTSTGHELPTLLGIYGRTQLDRTSDTGTVVGSEGDKVLGT